MLLWRAIAIRWRISISDEIEKSSPYSDPLHVCIEANCQRTFRSLLSVTHASHTSPCCSLQAKGKTSCLSASWKANRLSTKSICLNLTFNFSLSTNDHFPLSFCNDLLPHFYNSPYSSTADCNIWSRYLNAKKPTAILRHSILHFPFPFHDPIGPLVVLASLY